MSIAALNAQLSVLRGLLKSTSTDLQHTTDIMRDSAGDHTGAGRGGDTIGAGRNGDGPIKPRNVIGIGSLGASARSVAEAKKQISAHADEAKKEVAKAVDESLRKILSAFNPKDKALQDLIKYIDTRASVAYKGSEVLAHVTNIIRDLNAAAQMGDAHRIKELRDQMQEWLRVINQLLIGRGNKNFGPVDIDRLLGGFKGATSTGEAP